MIRSRTRRRDAYHLAALIAHHLLLDPAAESAMAPVAPARWGRRLAAAGGATAAGVATFFVIGALGDLHPSRLKFKQGEVLLTRSVSEAEATRVGENLLRQEYFSDQQPRSVQLDRRDGVYRLGFVVNASRAGETLVAVQYGLIGGAVARDALDGKPVELAFVDTKLQPIRVVPVTTQLAYGKSTLYYSDPVSAATARAAGDELLRIELFADQREATVHLAHEDETYQLRFVVNAHRATESGVIEAFKEIGRMVAASALSGAPVVVRLCDAELNTLHAERVVPVATPRPATQRIDAR
jgi:hypothetical protein